MVDRVHDFSRLSLERGVGGADAPRLEKFQVTLCFSGQAQVAQKS